MKGIPKEFTKNSKKMKGIPKELEGIQWNSNGVYGIQWISKEFEGTRNPYNFVGFPKVFLGIPKGGAWGRRKDASAIFFRPSENWGAKKKYKGL